MANLAKCIQGTIKYGITSAGTLGIAIGAVSLVTVSIIGTVTGYVVGGLDWTGISRWCEFLILNA